jgi:hypothetical protein
MDWVKTILMAVMTGFLLLVLPGTAAAVGGFNADTREGIHPAPIRQSASINWHKDPFAVCEREFSRKPSPITRLSSCGYHFLMTCSNSVFWL